MRATINPLISRAVTRRAITISSSSSSRTLQPHFLSRHIHSHSITRLQHVTHHHPPLFNIIRSISNTTLTLQQQEQPTAIVSGQQQQQGPSSSGSNQQQQQQQHEGSDSSSHSQAPPVQPRKPMRFPLATIIGALIGIYVGVRIVFKFNGVPFPDEWRLPIPPRRRAQTEERRLTLEEHEALDPFLRKVPPMPHQSHTLAEILTDLCEPLLEFESRVDAFIERKEAAKLALDSLHERRKLGSVPSSESQAIERAWQSIEQEERMVFQPRLQYLRMHFRRRSLELMERTQYNAERKVQAGKERMEKERMAKEARDAAMKASTSGDSAAIASANESASAASLAFAAAQSAEESLRSEIDAEMARYKCVAQKYSAVVHMIDRYGFHGSDITMRRMMAANQRNNEKAASQT